MVLRGKLRVGCDWIKASFCAQRQVPMIADRYMPDLIAKNDVQDLTSASIASTNKLGLYRW